MSDPTRAEGPSLSSRQNPTSSPPFEARRTCQALRRDGAPCRSFARTGSRFCFSHDPESAEEKRAACARGARATNQRRVLVATDEPPQLETPEDVRGVMSEVIFRLRKGELDRSTANSIMYGCQVTLKALSTRDMQRRIDDLERKLADLLKGRR